MRNRLLSTLLSLIFIPTVFCTAQVGVVTKDLSLNERVENFINDTNCNDDELNKLVQLIQNAGDLEQGLRVMNVATKRFPNSYYAFYMRGFYNRNLENFEEAIADFSKAISLEPRYAGAYLDRGECFKSLNRIDEAKADFYKAIEESNKLLEAGLQYPGIDFAKPFSLVGLGRYSDVQDWISQYDGDDYYDVACLYSKMRDRNNTLKYIQKALENGYANITFITTDNCMKWLSEDEQFVKLINEYQK